MSNATSEQNISTASKTGSASTAPKDCAEEAQDPTIIAFQSILGVMVLVLGLLVWSGDYTNAAMHGSIVVCFGCILRHRQLQSRGEETAAQRWAVAGYVLSASSLGYALYLLFF